MGERKPVLKTLFSLLLLLLLLFSFHLAVASARGVTGGMTGINAGGCCACRCCELDIGYCHNCCSYECCEKA